MKKTLLAITTFLWFFAIGWFVISSDLFAQTEVVETANLDSNGFGIEIRDLDIQPDVTEVYLRAWDSEGQQLGFGRDGTVEIERIRIYNMPLLVPDSSGLIVRSYLDKGTGRNVEQRFRIDETEALSQILGQILPAIGKEGSNIEEGKVGRTTSVFYPDPSVETTSVDGYVNHNTGAGSSWVTAHGATTGSANDSASTGEIQSREYDDEANRFELVRAFFLFDTSALPDTDEISAATVSLATVGTTINTDNDGTDYINIYASTPVSDTAIVSGDYDGIGNTALATPIDMGSLPAAGTYAVFNLNATGIAAISKTGITKLGAREGHDAENIEIAQNTRNLWAISMAETALTTLDPKLTVTHDVEGEPPPGEEETATSSAEIVHSYDAAQTLYNGMMLFMVMFGFMAFYFKKR